MKTNITKAIEIMDNYRSSFYGNATATIFNDRKNMMREFVATIKSLNTELSEMFKNVWITICQAENYCGRLDGYSYKDEGKAIESLKKAVEPMIGATEKLYVLPCWRA